jgi:hypothetical protein
MVKNVKSVFTEDGKTETNEFVLLTYHLALREKLALVTCIDCLW